MNTQHLRYFYDAFRLSSAFQAAQSNNVAPSTISQAIRALENELGYKLTKKQRGSLSLTTEGVAFAHQAFEILKIVDQIKLTPTAAGAQLTGLLRIATHQSFLNAIMWSALRAFRKRYPNVEVQISTGIGSQIAELLASQQIDIAVTLDEVAATQLTAISSEVLIEGEFKLVCSHKHKLSKEFPCIVTNVQKPEVKHLLRKASWLKVESQIPSWTTIQKVIDQEALFGYLPDYLINAEAMGHNYTEPRFAETLRYPYQVRLWYLYRHRNRQILQKFMEVAKDTLHL